MKSSSVTMVAMAAIACMAMVASVQGSCSSDLSPYKPCMPAVLGVAPPMPTIDCCKVIKAADISCLCTTVAAADIPSLNQEAALMLPKHCGAISPDSQTCGKHGAVNPLARKLMDLH
ncbi:hypothetical protein M758_12G015400 [Ceratodon purpureus]|nr:hypothetical protein M758_12G015400 [Ceratodon purpureus]